MGRLPLQCPYPVAKLLTIHDIPIVILICYGILCLIAPSSRWLKTLRCAKSLNFGTPQCF